MAWSIFRLAHPLYARAFPFYRTLYSAYKSYCDRHDRRFLSSLLRSGDTVIDVGANIGMYSVFFSRLVGEKGSVYSFEPDPLNYSHLKNAVRGLPNVYPCNAAVGENSGRIQLWKHASLNVDHRTFAVPGEERMAVDVQVVSLDDRFAGQNLHLLKLDVQGWEAAVLRGAAGILANPQRPAILFEFWPHALRQAGENPLEFLDWIQQVTQQRPRSLTGRGLEEFEASDHPLTHPEWYTNLFLAGST